MLLDQSNNFETRQKELNVRYEVVLDEVAFSQILSS